MVAALLGAGAVADAFLVAFQLVNVVRRLLTEGALNAALVPAYLRIREQEGAAAAAAFAGRLLGTISVALMAATVLIGVLMPFVISVLAPGFIGTETLQLAVSDARLMLPYLAFAGPVTVLMALLNAQGRFALAAFSPLLFNVALIAATIALLIMAAGRSFCRHGAGRNRRHCRTIAIVDPAAAPERRRRGMDTRQLRQRDAKLLRQSHSRHDREQRPAAADGCRRRHRLVFAVGDIVALFRGPADRIAAWPGRRRHGHGADSGIVARRAWRRRRRDRACAIARA